MKHFVIYLENGQIIRSGVCQDETFDLQANEGEFILETEYDSNQYVKDGQLVAMPAQPSPDYVFDYSTKNWVIDVFAATQKAYAKRNELLNTYIDRINPIWWASMTPEQQQTHINYRQHLLDIPAQQGFPIIINWGVPPSEA